jgi:hypothetical protein
MEWKRIDVQFANGARLSNGLSDRLNPARKLPPSGTIEITIEAVLRTANSVASSTSQPRIWEKLGAMRLSPRPFSPRNKHRLNYVEELL